MYQPAMKPEFKKDLPLTTEDRLLVDLLIYLRESGNPSKETGAGRDNDIPGQESINSVFRNHLLVSTICSYISDNDLLSFRSVNRLFHVVATPRVRLSRNPIVIRNSESMYRFLTLMETRLDSDNARSIPFTAFYLDLGQLSNEILEHFAEEIGPDVHRLSFAPAWFHVGAGRNPLEQKVLILLKGTVNIVEIDLVTGSPLSIPDHDLVSLPDSYPQLGVIRMDEYHLRPTSDPPQNLLVNVLISKSTTNLRHCYVHRMTIANILTADNPTLCTLQNLARHHVTSVVQYFKITVQPHSLPVLQTLQNMNLQIQHLTADVHLRSLDPNNEHENRDLLSSFYNWLATLSFNIYTLYMALNLPRSEAPANLVFPIPPLENLKYWTFFVVDVEEEENGDPPSPSTISIPVYRNQFPKLKIYCLYDSRNVLVSIPDSPQATVQEFNICSTKILEFSPQHQIFPILTTSRLNSKSWSPELKVNLVYVLRGFPNVNHLKLKLTHEDGEPEDYWDILTGGAPRPVSLEVLFQDVMPAEFMKPLEELIHEFRTPSLGNFRRLKTLKCYPGTRSNLDAILYMTRIGHLVPLRKLVILLDFDLEEDEKLAYRDRLAQVHTDVCIHDNID